MLKGYALKNNSKIGIVSPSSYEERNIITKKLTAFSYLGYKYKLGKHIYSHSSLFAGSDKERASDITEMFLDTSIDAILCFRGGYGCIRTIPYLDTKVILDNPKIFCGYSDITILLNYFSSLGLITFHGPMVNSNFNDKLTFDNFIKVLSYNSKNFIYDLNLYKKSISYINIKAFTGKIAGGNLAVICSSIGTPWQISLDNSILILEEINEYPYAIHRMLTQLIHCKMLERCKGIIIGYLSNVDNYNNSKDKYSLEKIIIDLLKPLDIPLIIGFPFGHNYPNLTIPIGSIASFSPETNLITISDNFLN